MVKMLASLPSRQAGSIPILDMSVHRLRKAQGVGIPAGVSSSSCSCFLGVLTRPLSPGSFFPHPCGICKPCPQLLTALDTVIQPETNDWLISKLPLIFPAGGVLTYFCFRCPSFPLFLLSLLVALALALFCQPEWDL